MGQDGPDGAAGAPAELAYAEALSSLTQLLLDRVSLEHVLDRLLASALVVAPDLDAASVTTRTEDGEYTAVTSTSEQALAVDEVEYALHEGPCVIAVETGEEQLVVDTETDHRWPGFRERALELGFRSVAGIPLKVRDATIGALDLFTSRPHGLDEETLVALRRLSHPMAAALGNARAYQRTERLSRELQERLDALGDVNQAIGILMARRGCDAATARALLVRTAESTGRPLEEVIEHLRRNAGA